MDEYCNVITSPNTAEAESIRIDAAVHTELTDWLSDYVMQPHPRLGRDGAVCPFAKPSADAGVMEFHSTPWHPGDGLDAMKRIAEQALELFESLPWRSANPNLRSLVVAITDLPRTQWHLVDEAHKTVKHRAVTVGLMLGQFHPECRMPSVHNPDFPVNRSPVPLLAVRRMSLHDILFLGDRRSWFHAYQSRFGHLYARHRVHEPHLTAAYTTAQRRYP
jgi:heptaprenyl diphosphate synthase